MENTSYVAISRHAALWRQLGALSNNMANVNTPGFKGEQMMFKEYLVKTPAPHRPSGETVSFVQDIGVLRDLSRGPLAKTENPLDLAIDGDGYFVVETPDGPRYTRAGHFRLDDAGTVVNSDGHALLQTSDLPLIFAPNETQISVSPEGVVSSENGEIGRLRVVQFENEQALRKVGGGLYETEQMAEEVEQPRVLQGMIEESNVKPILELTNMISILRQYEGMQKLLDNDNDRQIKAYEVLSQPSRA